MGTTHEGPSIMVGVDSKGQVVLMTSNQALVTMNLAAAEWLRDRLFHVCARERAAERAALEPVVAESAPKKDPSDA